MASVTSNLDEIEDLLNAVVDSFNFTAPGTQGKGLGNELLDVAAEGVLERTIARQQESSGKRLEPNAESYARTAKKKGKPISVLTGEMMGMTQLKGTRTIEPESAEMEYGVDPFPKRKGQWFTHGSAVNRAESDIEPSGAINQPQRPFYAMDDAIVENIHKRADQALQEHLDAI